MSDNFDPKREYHLEATILAAAEVLEALSNPCEFREWPDAQCEGTVELESSRTCYRWDGDGEDPNRPVRLCRAHSELHHAHWDEMWAEYYSAVR